MENIKLYMKCRNRLSNKCKCKPIADLKEQYNFVDFFVISQIRD